MAKRVLDSPRGGTTTVEDLYMLVAPAIPCEYVLGKVPNTTKCENEADWIIHIKGHCTPNSNTIRLVCDPCLKRIQGGDLWKCKRCGTIEAIGEYITKTERI